MISRLSSKDEVFLFKWKHWSLCENSGRRRNRVLKSISRNVNVDLAKVASWIDKAAEIKMLLKSLELTFSTATTHFDGLTQTKFGKTYIMFYSLNKDDKGSYISNPNFCKFFIVIECMIYII
jgi:hypothetical protein